MPSIGDDVDLFELILLLGIVGVIVYYVHQWATSSSCILKVGAIPGVTGATQQQVDAAKSAAGTLKPGGRVIWSCGSDFDYRQPCGTVTQARKSILNDFWPWGTSPMNYTCIPQDCYMMPSGGIASPNVETCPSGSGGGF